MLPGKIHDWVTFVSATSYAHCEAAAHWHGRPRSPPFCEYVPVPGARATLLLLGQRQKLEAGEERGKADQVAIVMRVSLGVAAADEGVGGDRPAGELLPVPTLRNPQRRDADPARSAANIQVFPRTAKSTQ